MVKLIYKCHTAFYSTGMKIKICTQYAVNFVHDDDDNSNENDDGNDDIVDDDDDDECMHPERLPSKDCALYGQKILTTFLHVAMVSIVYQVIPSTPTQVFISDTFSILYF